MKRIGSDVMLDERRYDPLTGREHFHRSVFRQDRPSREFDFSVRLFSLPELRGWLHDAGFEAIETGVMIPEITGYAIGRAPA